MSEEILFSRKVFKESEQEFERDVSKRFESIEHEVPKESEQVRILEK